MKRNLFGAIFTSLFVQGIGSSAPFITIVALARLGGTEIQGTFSAFKTWADLVSSLLVFGFPQAFVYLVHRKISKHSDLLNFSLLYSALASIIVIPAAIASVVFGYNAVPEGRNILVYSVLLACGTWAVVANRLIRAIYLTIDDGLAFALITSAPGFFVLLAMLTALAFQPFSYDVAYFGAGLLTCLATTVWVRGIVANDASYELKWVPIPIRALTVQSGHAFLQSLCLTLQPVLTIFFLIKYGGDVEKVAFFSSATLSISIINVFFGIIAPILFNRWTESISLALFTRVKRGASIITAVSIPILAAVTPLHGLLIPRLFGPEYEVAVPAFQALSIAIPAVAFTRIVYPAMHAAGNPASNSVSCALRLFGSVSTQLALAMWGTMDPVMCAVFGWILGEWAAALYTVYASSRMTTRWPS